MPGSSLRCVTIDDLIALRLYAGGRGDYAGIVHLLVRDAEADLQAIRAVAAPFAGGRQLDALIGQAAAYRLRRR